ncbi:MAG: protein kinase domain-containing protein [Bryobacteraceae bacterium]
MTDPDPESPDWQRVKEIFAEAGELPTAARAAHVHRAAAGDHALEREVLRLLRLDGGAEEWLDGLRPPTEVVQAAADLHAFFPGQVLAARYEIQQFLAVGGMGEVYSAHDLQLDQRIAIKVIAGELATVDQVSLLKREVQAARRIQHANVCRVFDLVQTEVARGRRAVFLTMELLEGETLSQKLHRDGALTERQAMPLIRQMVAALFAAHQAGVIHGDFKSSNVMIVSREGGSPRAVVTDFGLARRLAPGREQTLMSLSKSSLAGYGTPAYMSPEQIQGGKASQSADIYALGVVLYEMLTGELPYGEESPLAMAVKKTREPPVAPESLSPALRRTWSAAILKCMAAEPGRRFPDVREVLTHLETRTRRGLWWKLIRRRHRRLLRIAAVAAGVIAMLALARWLWPAEPGAEAVADWQQGVYDLQAGEPVAAARRLERAIAQHRLPPVAHAYLAWAWHELGFGGKAETELADSRRKPLQPEADRQLEEAAAAKFNGQPQQARAILARRGVLADLAFIDDQLGRPTAADEWKQVAAQSPSHPAAHLRLAQAAAKQGQWKQAEREFILAETYFNALGDADMVRAVSARRGFARVESGDLDQARTDLPSLFSLQPRLPNTGYGPCERTVTLMSGQDDNFALPFDPIPYVSPGFAPIFERDRKKHLKQFNEQIDDQFLYASIILPRLTFCSGRIETRIRKGKSGYQNDSLAYGVAPMVPPPCPIQPPCLFGRTGPTKTKGFSRTGSPGIFCWMYSARNSRSQSHLWTSPSATIPRSTTSRSR